MFECKFRKIKLHPVDSFYPNKFPPTSLNSIPLQHVITARHRFHLKGPTPKNKQKKKTHAPAHTHTHTHSLHWATFSLYVSLVAAAAAFLFITFGLSCCADWVISQEWASAVTNYKVDFFYGTTTCPVALESDTATARTAAASLKSRLSSSSSPAGTAAVEVRLLPCHPLAVGDWFV